MGILGPREGFAPGPPPSRRERLLARLMADRLDRALIAGVPPETSRLLSVRAELLLNPRHRRVLAQSLSLALDEANGLTRSAVRTVPVQGAAIREAASDLSELTTRLRSKERISAQSVAIVQVLLTDGASPLYNRNRAWALPVVARSALATAGG